MSLPARPAPLNPSVKAIYPTEREILDGGSGWQQEVRAAILQQSPESERLGVVLVDGTLAHTSLVRLRGFASIDGSPKQIALRPGQVCVHHCETSPSFRGKGLYPLMLQQILRTECLEPSAKEALITCRRSNAASIQGIIKAGFVYSCSYLAAGFLGERICFSHRYLDRRLARVTL